MNESLRKYDAPADRIRLHLQSTNKKVLLVEGAESDAVLFADLLPEVAVFPTGSRTILLGVAGDLLRCGIRQFVAIPDVDFTDLPKGDTWEAVLYPYEGRDLEGMLIGLGSFHRLLRFKGSLAKIEEYGGLDCLVADLVELVTPVTRLRLLSARDGVGLCFDRVDLAGKIDTSTLEFAVANYCMSLVWASETVGISVGEALDFAREPTFYPGPPRGKDVLTAVGCALRKVAGSLPKAAADVSVLSKDLLAVAVVDVRDSDWFDGLTAALAA